MKKSLIVIATFFAVVLSGCIGFFIGSHIFGPYFVVCEYNNSIISYSIQFGYIQSSSWGVAGDGNENPLSQNVNINLDGIHNSKDAVKEIEKQISQLGGHIISVIQ